MATTNTKKTTTKTTVKENKDIKDAAVVEKEVEDTAKVVEETVKETVAEALKEAIKEVAKETIEESKPVVVEEEKKAFTDSDYILCRSVYSGGLNVTSQSGNLYRFKSYGAECEINYRDLVTMIRRGSSHVFLPRFIILDEDFLAEFPTVQKVYGEMYTKEDLLAILDLPTVSSMKAEIAKLPDATKNSLSKLVATQIATGRLDSVAKIRALTEIFNSDFNLLSELLVK